MPAFIPTEKPCFVCKTPFKATAPAHAYCSDTCHDVIRARRWALSLLGFARKLSASSYACPKPLRAYIAGLTHDCGYCGGPVQGMSTFCSSTCRTSHFRSIGAWVETYAAAASQASALPGTDGGPRFLNRRDFDKADTLRFNPGTLSVRSTDKLAGLPILTIMPAYLKPASIVTKLRDGMAFMCDRALDRQNLPIREYQSKRNDMLDLFGLPELGLIDTLRSQWLDQAFADLMERRKAFMQNPPRFRSAKQRRMELALDEDNADIVRMAPPRDRSMPVGASRDALHRMISQSTKMLPPDLDVQVHGRRMDTAPAPIPEPSSVPEPADIVHTSEEPEGRQWTEEEETYTCPGGRTFNPWKTDPRNPGKAALAALYIGDEPGLGVVQAHLAKARAFTIRGGWDRDTDEPGPIEEISPGCFIADKEYLYG